MTIPNVLYKYVDPARIDILWNQEIRFTQVRCLNDPFEFSPGLPDGKEELGNVEQWCCKRWGDEYRRKSLFYAVLCLTENNDSIPMWTHYAHGHTGLVIGFDTKSEPFRTAFEDRKIRRVSYRSDRLCITRGADSDEQALLTKSTEWGYEKEWRWIECRKPNEYARVVSQDSVPLFLAPIPAESMVEVVLGCRAGTDLVETVRTLREIPKYKHLGLFRIRPDDSHYKLVTETM